MPTGSWSKKRRRSLRTTLSDKSNTSSSTASSKLGSTTIPSIDSLLRETPEAFSSNTFTRTNYIMTGSLISTIIGRVTKKFDPGQKITFVPANHPKIAPLGRKFPISLPTTQIDPAGKEKERKTRKGVENNKGLELSRALRVRKLADGHTRWHAGTIKMYIMYIIIIYHNS